MTDARFKPGFYHLVKGLHVDDIPAFVVAVQPKKGGDSSPPF